MYSIIYTQQMASFIITVRGIVCLVDRNSNTEIYCVLANIPFQVLGSHINFYRNCVAVVTRSIPCAEEVGNMYDWL